jgi:hypothetical protein
MPACCSTPSSSSSSTSITSAINSDTAAGGRPGGYSTARPTTSPGPSSASSTTGLGAASYVHLGPERINADGSLSTAYTRYRQQQQQQQQQQAPHSGNAQSSSHSSHQHWSTATGSSSSSSSSSRPSSSGSGSAAAQHAPRPPGLSAAAPTAVPASRQQLDQLADLIQSSRRVVVITGAGCSTESNIPDYRGPGGAYTTGTVDASSAAAWHVRLQMYVMLRVCQRAS